MKAENKSRTAGTKEVYGLVAVGSCGAWQVAVDETIGGAQRWFAQIEGPTYYLYFEVGQANVFMNLLDFLRKHLQRIPAQAGSSQWSDEVDTLKLGRCGGHYVEILWDREPGDRCFILVRGTGAFCLRAMLDRGDIEAFAGALEQVCLSLCEDGLVSAST